MTRGFQRLVAPSGDLRLMIYIIKTGTKLRTGTGTGNRTGPKLSTRTGTWYC